MTTPKEPAPILDTSTATDAQIGEMKFAMTVPLRAAVTAVRTHSSLRGDGANAEKVLTDAAAMLQSRMIRRQPVTEEVISRTFEAVGGTMAGRGATPSDPGKKLTSAQLGVVKQAYIDKVHNPTVKTWERLQAPSQPESFTERVSGGNPLLTTLNINRIAEDARGEFDFSLAGHQIQAGKALHAGGAAKHVIDMFNEGAINLSNILHKGTGVITPAVVDSSFDKLNEQVQKGTYHSPSGAVSGTTLQALTADELNTAKAAYKEIILAPLAASQVAEPFLSSDTRPDSGWGR